jgi:hypothetical protein
MESSFGNSSYVPKSEDWDSTKPVPYSYDLDSNRLVYNIALMGGYLSFDGHGLRQISRLVNIGPFNQGHMIS